MFLEVWAAKMPLVCKIGTHGHKEGDGDEEGGPDHAARVRTQHAFPGEGAGVAGITQVAQRPGVVEPAPLPQIDLPDLPDFLTGHIDPLSGLDDSNDGDGSASRAALLPLYSDPTSTTRSTIG